MATTEPIGEHELRRYASQPVFEVYADEASGARIELHPWFYVGGRELTGVTRFEPPGTGRGLPHVHVGMEQRNVVHHGRATYELGSWSRTKAVLEPGTELVIPPGAPHVDPYNASDEPLCVGAFYTPAPLAFVSLGRALGEALRDGRLNAQHELEPLALMVALDQPGNMTFAAGVPVALQRRVGIPFAAALGRRRGHRAPAGLGRR